MHIQALKHKTFKKYNVVIHIGSHKIMVNYICIMNKHVCANKYKYKDIT